MRPSGDPDGSRTLGLILIVALILFLIWNACSTIALSFPENVRHGYPSCASCHVSGPAGGGALKPYGRSAGAEVMPTWKLSEPQAPEWIAYGGDFRYVSFPTYKNSIRRENFIMQRDVEAALEPVPGFWVGGSYGLYGEDETVEYRRSYAKLELWDHVALRVGRFMPAYGIGFPDHRLPTRQGLGLGQGGESFGAEATVSGSRGELTLTRLAGSKAVVEADAREGYVIRADRRNGFAARGAAFIGDSAQVGASAMRDELMSAHGVHAIVGLKQAYVLAEWDRRFAGGSRADVAVGQLGYEWRGVHAGPTVSWDGLLARYGYFLGWLPTRHLELRLSTERVDGRIESVGMFHWFL